MQAQPNSKPVWECPNPYAGVRRCYFSRNSRRRTLKRGRLRITILNLSLPFFFLPSHRGRPEKQSGVRASNALLNKHHAALQQAFGWRWWALLWRHGIPAIMTMYRQQHVVVWVHTFLIWVLKTDRCSNVFVCDGRQETGRHLNHTRKRYKDGYVPRALHFGSLRLVQQQRSMQLQGISSSFDIKFRSSYGTRKDKYYRKAKTLNITFTVRDSMTQVRVAPNNSPSLLTLRYLAWRIVQSQSCLPRRAAWLSAGV